MLSSKSRAGIGIGGIGIGVGIGVAHHREGGSRREGGPVVRLGAVRGARHRVCGRCCWRVGANQHSYRIAMESVRMTLLKFEHRT